MPVKVAGILNITEDSFSDGGKYLSDEKAAERAADLIKEGAHIIDIGAASSNPDAGEVDPGTETGRVKNAIESVRNSKVACEISVDTFKTEVQRFAIGAAADYLNDIKGFSDRSFYDELADADCKLIVMHMIQSGSKADVSVINPAEIYSMVCRFFESRLNDLKYAGIDESRLILDPGMGFFLGSDPQCSYEILRRLPHLKKEFGFPVMVSVSRKSFLAGPAAKPPLERKAATVVAEALAFQAGADYIRTHEPAGTLDAVRVIDEYRRHCPD